MSQRFDVVVLGGINTDYTIKTEALPRAGQSVRGESFYCGPGGKGANQAVAAARLGARVAMIGRVGEEVRGREMVKALRREKVDTRHVSFDGRNATGAAIIAVDAEGEKQIAAALSANQTMKLEQIRAAEATIGSAGILLCNFEAPLAAVLAAAKIARKHGVRRAAAEGSSGAVEAGVCRPAEFGRSRTDDGDRGERSGVGEEGGGAIDWDGCEGGGFAGGRCGEPGGLGRRRGVFSAAHESQSGGCDGRGRCVRGGIFGGVGRRAEPSRRSGIGVGDRSAFDDEDGRAGSVADATRGRAVRANAWAIELFWFQFGPKLPMR
jgi:hypothetical protein